MRLFVSKRHTEWQGSWGMEVYRQLRALAGAVHCEWANSIDLYATRRLSVHNIALLAEMLIELVLVQETYT
jgi:hypothetical protein